MPRLVRYAPTVGEVTLLAYLGTSGEEPCGFTHVAGFLAGLLLGALYEKLGARIMAGPRIHCLLGIGRLGFLGLARM